MFPKPTSPSVGYASERAVLCPRSNRAGPHCAWICPFGLILIV